jgi:cell division protein ZapA
VLETVEIAIGGRRFRLQCGPGEAARVQQLARLVDQCASTLIQGQRGMGEEKVLLLSSLIMADRLEEARGEIDRLVAGAARGRAVLQDRAALAVATAAKRLDAVAAEIERAAATATTG